MQTLKRTKAFLTRYRDGYHRFRQEHSKLSVWITVAVCLLVLWGVFTPSANPFRSDKLVISGEFPYDKGFEFVVDQSAQTTNPIVNFVCGGFGFFKDIKGFPCTGGRQTLYPVRMGCCHYELTYYRDYYWSGFAGWKSSGLWLDAYSTDTSLPRGGGFTNFTPRKSEIVCLDSLEKLKLLKGLHCRMGHGATGFSIYDPSLRQATVNFRLESEVQKQSQ
jgi:hypothetical protein